MKAFIVSGLVSRGERDWGHRARAGVWLDASAATGECIGEWLIDGWRIESIDVVEFPFELIDEIANLKGEVVDP